MKVIAIFIALNAQKSLPNFWQAFPKKLVDRAILVDDNSDDKTFTVAKKLGIEAYKNTTRLGYGGNMKKALNLALKMGADVIIDLHPDGEYKADSISAALEKIKQGNLLVLGNRFDNFDRPLKNGMRYWKFFPILALNLIARMVLNVPLTDFHQGFRVYTKKLLKQIDYQKNSNGYLFSFELIVQAAEKGLLIAEVPVVAIYKGQKRGASLRNSVIYSIGTFLVLRKYIVKKIIGKYGI